MQSILCYASNSKAPYNTWQMHQIFYWSRYNIKIVILRSWHGFLKQLLVKSCSKEDSILLDNVHFLLKYTWYNTFPFCKSINLFKFSLWFIVYNWKWKNATLHPASYVLVSSLKGSHRTKAGSSFILAAIFTMAIHSIVCSLVYVWLCLVVVKGGATTLPQCQNSDPPCVYKDVEPKTVCEGNNASLEITFKLPPAVLQKFPPHNISVVHQNQIIIQGSEVKCFLTNDGGKARWKTQSLYKGQLLVFQVINSKVQKRDEFYSHFVLQVGSGKLETHPSKWYTVKDCSILGYFQANWDKMLSIGLVITLTITAIWLYLHRLQWSC